MVTISVDTQITNRDVELLCERLQKFQKKKICLYTQKLKTFIVCVDKQIPKREVFSGVSADVHRHPSPKLVYKVGHAQIFQ